MICYSISQRTKILWFYTKNQIKFTQQKFKDHFNVAWTPRKQTILSLVDKFLTTGSEMLDSLILTFPKEGTENVLVTLNSFFDAFVFSYCCCAPFKDKHSCNTKGLTNDKHLDEHFVMIRTIPLIKLLYIYIIKMYCFAV